VREKYCFGWKNKLKKTDYKPDEQALCLHSRPLCTVYMWVWLCLTRISLGSSSRRRCLLCLFGGPKKTDETIIIRCKQIHRVRCRAAGRANYKAASKMAKQKWDRGRRRTDALFTWIYRTFSAKQRYFSLTTNQLQPQHQP
jgi:hypothetical protein